ncbi:unnamed protein product [Cylindrotheca closterium]|uniref:Protein-serine/threonine phosphatase n=1 Tax=Cylindrotheca closterium TaxID=2856 RepID=A0AAD2CN61_9STRA|nr:unnamed protein product [Cylindrotheca closterium]
MAIDKATTNRPSSRGQPVEILPKLWLGSLASLKHLSNQESSSWTVISVLGSDKLVSMTNFMLQDAKHTKRCRRHIVWELEDKNNSIFFSGELVGILRVIDEALQQQNCDKILVHCAMGVSRSVTICAAWIMTRQRRSLQETMEIIRAVRPEAMPNMGFTASLRALEASDFDIKKARKRLGQDEGSTGDL